MKITESQLRQIILEEIEMVELEELLITEAAKLGIVLTEEQKKGLLQRIKQKAARVAGPLAVGAALAGGGAALHGVQSDYEQGVRDQISQNMAAAEEYNSSYEGKLAPLQKQLDNTAAFLWTMSDNPTDMTMLPLTDGGAGILPPDWSVMKRVHDDFVAGDGPLFTPDQVIQDSGDSERSRTNFLQDFENTEYQGWGGDPRTGVDGTVYIDFDDLPEDYTLPLSTDSPSEYYVQLWDQYVGY
jgi:hypothetical protein